MQSEVTCMFLQKNKKLEEGLRLESNVSCANVATTTTIKTIPHHRLPGRPGLFELEFYFLARIS